MSKLNENPTNTLGLWGGILSFFLVGATVGILSVLALLDTGQKTFTAITFGATAGGFAAWFLFFVGANIWNAISKQNEDA